MIGSELISTAVLAAIPSLVERVTDVIPEELWVTRRDAFEDFKTARGRQRNCRGDVEQRNWAAGARLSEVEVA